MVFQYRQRSANPSPSQGDNNTKRCQDTILCKTMTYFDLKGYCFLKVTHLHPCRQPTNVQNQSNFIDLDVSFCWTCFLWVSVSLCRLTSYSPPCPIEKDVLQRSQKALSVSPSTPFSHKYSFSQFFLYPHLLFLIDDGGASDSVSFSIFRIGKRASKSSFPVCLVCTCVRCHDNNEKVDNDLVSSSTEGWVWQQ